MGTMTDAVDPANIPASLDGKPALHVTVLADAQAECFDLEQGNASAAEVADACRVRYERGEWSLVYVNEATQGQLIGALGAKELRLSGYQLWPDPGVYLGVAAPGTPAGKAPVWASVPPVFVQDTYAGTYDQSTTFGAFPAEVLGYIDGPKSAWPAAAWARFTSITAPAPAAPSESEDDVTTEELNECLKIFFAPPNEGYGRLVSAANESLKESQEVIANAVVARIGGQAPAAPAPEAAPK